MSNKNSVIHKGDVIYSAIVSSNDEKYSLVKSVFFTRLTLTPIATRIRGKISLDDSEQAISARILQFNSKDSFRLFFSETSDDSLSHVVESDVFPGEIIPRVKALLETI